MLCSYSSSLAIICLSVLGDLVFENESKRLNARQYTALAVQPQFHPMYVRVGEVIQIAGLAAAEGVLE